MKGQGASSRIRFSMPGHLDVVTVVVVNANVPNALGHDIVFVPGAASRVRCSPGEA